MCRSSESRLESCFPHAVHVHCGGRAGLRTIAKRLTGLPGSRFDMHQLFHTSRERSTRTRRAGHSGDAPWTGAQAQRWPLSSSVPRMQ